MTPYIWPLAGFVVVTVLGAIAQSIARAAFASGSRTTFKAATMAYDFATYLLGIIAGYMLWGVRS